MPFEPKEEPDVLHSAALKMTSQIVSRLLQDCVFKNAKTKKSNGNELDAFNES